MNKLEIGSKLRHAIAYYTDLTVDEQLIQTITPEADEAWKDIEELISQLERV